MTGEIIPPSSSCEIKTQKPLNIRTGGEYKVVAEFSGANDKYTVSDTIEVEPNLDVQVSYDNGVFDNAYVYIGYEGSLDKARATNKNGVASFNNLDQDNIDKIRVTCANPDIDRSKKVDIDLSNTHEYEFELVPAPEPGNCRDKNLDTDAVS